MSERMTPRLFPVSLLIGLLAGCATTPPPDVRRDARLDPQVGAAGATQTTAEQRADGNASAKPTPVIRRGSGTGRGMVPVQASHPPRTTAPSAAMRRSLIAGRQRPRAGARRPRPPARGAWRG